MRIDRLLVVGVLTLCVMTGCKGKKEDKPKTMQANPVSSLTQNIL
jgi:hypothetical protein